MTKVCRTVTFAKTLSLTPKFLGVNPYARSEGKRSSKPHPFGKPSQGRRVALVDIVYRRRTTASSAFWQQPRAEAASRGRHSALLYSIP
jgi:hypothetical protein